jgi:hypothetical protein
MTIHVYTSGHLTGVVDDYDSRGVLQFPQTPIVHHLPRSTRDEPGLEPYFEIGRTEDGVPFCRYYMGLDRTSEDQLARGLDMLRSRLTIPVFEATSPPVGATACLTLLRGDVKDDVVTLYIYVCPGWSDTTTYDGLWESIRSLGRLTASDLVWDCLSD